METPTSTPTAESQSVPLKEQSQELNNHAEEFYKKQLELLEARRKFKNNCKTNLKEWSLIIVAGFGVVLVSLLLIGLVGASWLFLKENVFNKKTFLEQLQQKVDSLETTLNSQRNYHYVANSNIMVLKPVQ